MADGDSLSRPFAERRHVLESPVHPKLDGPVDRGIVGRSPGANRNLAERGNLLFPCELHVHGRHLPLTDTETRQHTVAILLRCSMPDDPACPTLRLTPPPAIRTSSRCWGRESTTSMSTASRFPSANWWLSPA